MAKVTDDPKTAEAGDVNSMGAIWSINGFDLYPNEGCEVWVRRDDLPLYEYHGWSIVGVADNFEEFVSVRRGA